MAERNTSLRTATALPLKLRLLWCADEMDRSAEEIERHQRERHEPKLSPELLEAAEGNRLMASTMRNAVERIEELEDIRKREHKEPQ